jgi:hypothetical protein
MEKELIFSVTKKDLVITYFSGHGPGGQHRNKCKNCVRIQHPESGVTTVGTEERSLDKNKQNAFRRLTEHPDFKKWLKYKTAVMSGAVEKIKKDIEKELETNIRIDEKDENGRWKEININDLKDEN